MRGFVVILTIAISHATAGKHKTIYDPAGRNVGRYTTSPQR